MTTNLKTPENLPLMPLGCVSPTIHEDLFKKRLISEFREICPIEYQKTNLNDARMPSRIVQNKVLTWEPTSKGLMLCGKTGLGKTRLVWKLVEKLMIDDGIRVRVINDPSLSREYSKRVSEGTANDWVDRLSETPVLFIDDFGKSSPTARYKEAFYDILENRTNNGKPILITSQWDASDIVTQFGDHDGAAIVRRLMEFCNIIGVN